MHSRWQRPLRRRGSSGRLVGLAASVALAAVGVIIPDGPGSCGHDSCCPGSSGHGGLSSVSFLQDEVAVAVASTFSLSLSLS